MMRCPGTLLLLFLLVLKTTTADDQTRPVADAPTLRSWLQNMVWFHRYTDEEVQQVTGLTADELAQKLTEFDIDRNSPPPRSRDRLTLLPYPGGRHPRTGFLDGAIAPQRETKLSAFSPWDLTSYAVLDVPEAIWSNLGLTYLAHTHIDTVWDKRDVQLPRQEWTRETDGSFVSERTLPNGILFGTKVIPMKDHLRMKMWLTNGSDQPLSDLRVQNCVMLKGMAGFEQQTNENKIFRDGYAIARSADSHRWLISAWDPVHRAWGNAPCPCLHSDPKFEDCPVGETKFLRGWFSFYEGTEIDQELARIEATGWRRHPLHHVTGNVTGRVRDRESGQLLPARIYVQNLQTSQFYFGQSTAVGGSAVVYDKQAGGSPSIERHTSLSADPFQLTLPPGKYRIRAERGKEYVPTEVEFTVPAPVSPVDDTAADDTAADDTSSAVTSPVVTSPNESAGPRGLLSTSASDRISVNLDLSRFVSMPNGGWYSGDTHVHRSMEELPNLVLAEDLNVALPLNYWVRDSTQIPAASGPIREATLIQVDDSHVIYPINTEYEIFTVDGKRHTLGAVFVLNHKTPLTLSAPPTRGIAEEARRQGALLDLDKHSWNWSVMIVPVMGVDLFELANNHHWRTQFGFPNWTLEAAPDWPEIERNALGFTESGWTEFGFQTYYAFLNCGFRMRVTGGTAAGVHPVPLGHGRVYVHCGPTFDYENWIRNLNAGHSFVTTGPLLDVRFDGELPGTTWVSTEPKRTIHITGTLHSLHPIQRLEIVANGTVFPVTEFLSVSGPQGGFLTNVDVRHTLENSGWIALRCDEKMPQGKVSFAHTNPVFVDVPDKPVRPRKRDAAYFVQRMQDEIERNRSVLNDASMAEYHTALQIYEALLQTAVE